MPVVYQRNFHQIATHNLGNYLGHDKGGFTHDESLAKIQKGNPYEENQFRGAVPDSQIFCRDSQVLGYSLSQMRAAIIRIEVAIFQWFFNGIDS